MSETKTNAKEQQTYVNADVESDSDSKQALDEEDRLQQDLNQQVAEENTNITIMEDMYDPHLLSDGFEIADDDEFVEYGVASIPMTGFTFPTNQPSIVELIFDAEQQKYVIATSRAMSSFTVDCDDRNK